LAGYAEIACKNRYNGNGPDKKDILTGHTLRIMRRKEIARPAQFDTFVSLRA